ncbi:MAG: hypothetical protein AB1630_06280 [bacterium]
MIATPTVIRERLEGVFEKNQADVLASAIFDSYNELVKASDFNELKGIVKELGVRVNDLAVEVSDLTLDVKALAQAQKRTEARVEEFATAQKELAEAQKETQIEIKKLTLAIERTNDNVGGIGETMGYALENEAYRALPKYLKEREGIEITERFVRTEIKGEEINIFAIGKRNGKPIIIVGEAESKMKDFEKFKQLERKVKAIRKQYKDDIVRILLTHYAPSKIIQKAKEEGIILIQSFEW